MKVALALIFLLSLVFCSRVPKGINVSQTSILASNWELGNRAPSGTEISFSVAMRQSNLLKLKQLFDQVSNPRSANYGEYLTPSEVESLVQTTPEDVERVRTWLQENEIDTENCKVVNGDFLRCENQKVQNIENLLHCEIYILNSKTDENKISLTHLNQLTVPFEVSEVVDLIQGLSFIPYRKAIFHEGDDPFQEISNSFEDFISSSKPLFVSSSSEEEPNSYSPVSPIRDEETEATSCPASAPTGCSTSNGVSAEFCCPEYSVCCPNPTGGVCCVGGNTCCYGQCLAATACAAPYDTFVQPEVLRDHYNVPMNMRATENLFNQSVVAFVDEFSQGALESFYGVFNEVEVSPHREGPPGCLPNCDQFESDLDMQYMSSMGSGVGLWFWYNQEGYTLEWAQSVLASSDYPLVFSISYISGEYQLGKDYITRSNTEFIKMGSIGITVMACSGDTGAPGWSINFPVDPLARNFPFDCPDCPLGINYCNQITLQTSERFCNVPSGMYSRDLERGVGCDLLLNNNDCQMAFQNFSSLAGDQCAFSIVLDRENVPRIFTLSDTCDCASLPTVSYGDCTISGFQFEESNGEPLTSLYPASSPFATAVGATQFSEQTNYLCNQKLFGETITCDIGEITSSIATGSLITSGGGFSTLSLAESYQTEAVNGYLSSGVPLPSGFYNSSLRAYPDVAFGGHKWLIAYSKDSTEDCPCDYSTVDGTSCASPGFSGLVSLLNQELLAARRPPLGFLNHLLYQMAENSPQSFQDITAGDNYCTEYLCSDNVGYRAAVGWDAVTGLGTPNFANMLEYIMSN